MLFPKDEETPSDHIVQVSSGVCFLARFGGAHQQFLIARKRSLREGMYRAKSY